MSHVTHIALRHSTPAGAQPWRLCLGHRHASSCSQVDCPLHVQVRQAGTSPPPGPCLMSPGSTLLLLLLLPRPARVLRTHDLGRASSPSSTCSSYSSVRASRCRSTVLAPGLPGAPRASSATATPSGPLLRIWRPDVSVRGLGTQALRPGTPRAHCSAAASRASDTHSSTTHSAAATMTLAHSRVKPPRLYNVTRRGSRGT
mmetsp:Transcript_32546/g.71835  ORF Transcript_32546/g.71835 Transcript_32546/m.71835 type:complete len:201 (-) Transcript_32546:1770-2372(-)